MPDNLIDKLLVWIQSNPRFFGGVERTLLAVSGGADSVAMAHALVRLKQEGTVMCEFVIGHINHCLRGLESDADEVFVKTLANELKLPFVSESVDVAAYAKEHKLSIETAGRKLRLASLAIMAEEYSCTRIATAHHKDDQAETVIHRLMRGTGFRGLCGIRPLSVIGTSVYIRPMLNLRRSEIIEYCRQKSIHWRDDTSNISLAFTRNRIRHTILPELQGRSECVESLAGLAAAAQRLHSRIEGKLKDSLQELCIENTGFKRVRFDQKKLSNYSPWTFYEIIRQSLMTLGAGLRDYTQDHFDAIREMAGQIKAKADFPSRIEVIVKDATIYIQHQGYRPSKPKSNGSVILGFEDTVQFDSWQISSRLLNAEQVGLDHFLKKKDAFVEWFDAGKIYWPMQIRQWQKSDRFWPIGGTGEKKVTRFLQDAQLDSQTKEQAFIIQDAQKILWLAPIRMSEEVKVTQETHKILEVRLLSDSQN